MFPSSPRLRLRTRRWLFVINLFFIITMLFVSIFAAGDFVSFLIHIGSLASWAYYVPWACTIDWRARREENRRRNRDDETGRRTVEERNKNLIGRKWWIIDKAWHEVLFLVFQGVCWLGSAVTGGIIGGPQVCQVNIDSAGVVSAIDQLVDNNDIAQFCAAMTASIALSCVGFVIVMCWMWWTIYAIKSLRKDRKEKVDGVDYIVKEKAWTHSMSELLRRHPEIERYVVKRYGADGLELSDMGSSDASGTSIQQQRAPRPTIDTTGLSPGSGGAGPITGSEGTTSGEEPGTGTGTASLSHAPTSLYTSMTRTSRAEVSNAPPTGLDGEADAQDTPYEGLPGEMAPPPYIRAHAAAATTTSPRSATTAQTGGDTSISPTTPTTLTHSRSQRRPLPLAPGQVERVVDRKMEEMASGTMIGSAGTSTFERALRATPNGENQLGAGSGSIGTYPNGSSTEGTTLYRLASRSQGGSSSLAQPLEMTMEQLVDRKINQVQPESGTGTGVDSNTARLAALHSHSPPRIDPNMAASENNTWPRVSHPTSTDGQGASPVYESSRYARASVSGPSGPGPYHTTGVAGRKGKAAEAGFLLDQPILGLGSSSGSSSVPGQIANSPEVYTREQSDEMTLEEMIERKLRSLKVDRARTLALERASSKSPTAAAGNGSPLSAVLATGGISALPSRTVSKGGGKGKRRARAGSDPGPALPRRPHEDDEDDEGD